VMSFGRVDYRIAVYL